MYPPCVAITSLNYKWVFATRVEPFVCARARARERALKRLSDGLYNSRSLNKLSVTRKERNASDEGNEFPRGLPAGNTRGLVR